jgi:hypothetical protein
VTAKQIVDSPVLKLVAYAVVLTLAFATLKAEVQQKADKAAVEVMAEDIRDIKNILCHNNTDSFCNPNPR